MTVHLRPCYSGGPVNSLEKLSKAIGFTAAALTIVSSEIQNHYKLIRIKKSDETFRECWNPSPQLRSIQKSINNHFLSRVIHSPFLHGSIKKRDYTTNAESHVGARWCACLDIKGFFPSIASHLVNDTIWKKFFNCSEPVAKLLTDLTTLNGCVPQGSLTASHIANLILWRHEPRLVAWLEDRKFRYTRYVDDIAISSSIYPDNSTKTKIISQIYKMLAINGLRLKRSKTEIFSAARGATIVGLNVSSKYGRSKFYRDAIARSIINFQSDSTCLSEAQAKKIYLSIRGRIAEIGRYHQRDARHLNDLLDAMILD